MVQKIIKHFSCWELIYILKILNYPHIPHVRFTYAWLNDLAKYFKIYHIFGIRNFILCYSYALLNDLAKYFKIYHLFRIRKFIMRYSNPWPMHWYMVYIRNIIIIQNYGKFAIVSLCYFILQKIAKYCLRSYYMLTVFRIRINLIW